ncbi:glycosyltransferase [Methylobacterium haplocladii]|uniref:Glycosyltransferase n=1 Tax=Methylobacterium haplocladii TaxID=1176176 RepID=A0A512IW09_9HYPH|nr:glycosyltransferase [Methylobacterium haplocladii]GEP01875.1 hypothetical protein MHA02_42620 [Methylobacterium haplocladii]GJD86440.1 D-inositol-3-phosphate glycosyltransferase [Methylobacterium haplocladii]GLS61171.1 hypothetical protein GCM10007887_38680 [Methylobacterium haplocladii]
MSSPDTSLAVDVAAPTGRLLAGEGVATPPVSIIINTDGRVRNLALTLESLRQLDYPNFEVCVVYGPTQDGTRELAESWSDRIKVAHCPTRNLSQSRNIGLALSAGEIVAFLDDDAIPEPEWLRQVVIPFSDPVVGACGGFLLDHTGVSFQWRFGTANRMGLADTTWDRPMPEYNFPYSANYPIAIGANSAFRRSAVMEIGGFDEQFIYFLDETDVMVRLVDRGYHVAQVEGALVHHKYAASHIRSEGRMLTAWYAIIRSKIYFSLVNAGGHHDMMDAVASTRVFVEGLNKDLEWGISTGRLSPDLRDRFRDDVDRGLASGLKEALAENRLFYDAVALLRHEGPFMPFPRLTPEGRRRTICLLTQYYPPGSIGGIGRYVHQLARAIAALGHQVHVLTKAQGNDSVDLEDGVWVHRIAPKQIRRSREAIDAQIPQHIWNYSATMLLVAHGVAAERPIDAVFAPIWDCEGIAFLLDGSWPLVTSLHTTLSFYLESHSYRLEDETFMETFARPMLALEQRLFVESPAILANSKAIIEQIEQSYGVSFDSQAIEIVAHGQEDWSAFPVQLPAPVPDGALRLLFVGRLEERKGIDVLLEMLPALLEAHPELVVDVVGNDTLASGQGETYRELFETRHATQAFLPRVRFHGEVEEAELLGFYKACDLFVAPSRFESFGLILLEAMVFGKPVIACRAGGMTEVVEHGVTGLLAEPGDAPSLAAAVETLVGSAPMRARMGRAGRERYEARFTPTHMAEGVLAFLSSVVDRAEAGGAEHG